MEHECCGGVLSFKIFFCKGCQEREAKIKWVVGVVLMYCQSSVIAYLKVGLWQVESVAKPLYCDRGGEEVWLRENRQSRRNRQDLQIDSVSSSTHNVTDGLG